MNSPKKIGGRPILCLDFDGVLHWYRHGWQSPTVIDDEPVPGAVDFVNHAMEYFKVVVYSSRSSHPGGIEAMRIWMQENGFPELEFATQKPAAFLTIDDRALNFAGVWPDPRTLRAYQPWTRQNATDPGGLTTERNENAEEENCMLKDLIIKSRSVRRFYQDQPVSMETLHELVDLARLSPSGSNLQPLKFLLSNDSEKNAIIFQHLSWAGYLRDWPGPEEGERPAAYILIMGDSTISKTFGCDHGIAAQSIMLGAAEKGLGGCIIGSIQRIQLSALLHLPPQFELLLALALGKPKEEVHIEEVGPDGSVRYWRDENRVHHVPKRPLDEIIYE